MYRSDDDGETWSPRPISVIRSRNPRWGLQAPTLFAFPTRLGPFGAGTVLAAGTAWDRATPDYSAQAIEIYRSEDGGRTWVFHSTLAEVRGVPNAPGYGIWEPTFAVDANGDLVGFWSHERYASPPNNYNQVIVHRTSRDGGLTWSAPTLDVAIADGVQRPGMPTIVRLPDGTFRMAYENCLGGVDPDHACAVHVKSSNDGQRWRPEEHGEVAATHEGRHLLHTPYLTWAAGPEGTGEMGVLVLAGQRVVRGPDGAKEVLPESGRVLFLNWHGGAGPWFEFTAPFAVEPTGGYSPGEAACPNYSSSLLASRDGSSVLMLASVLNTASACAVRFGTVALPAAPSSGTRSATDVEEIA